MQTHVHTSKYYVNRLTKCLTSHVIAGILNVINVVRHHILSDEKVLPRHQHARHATINIILNYFASLICEIKFD